MFIRANTLRVVVVGSSSNSSSSTHVMCEKATSRHTRPHIHAHWLQGISKLTRVGINKSMFKPTVDAIQARYYAKYSVGGKLPEEDMEDTPAPAPPHPHPHRARQQGALASCVFHESERCVSLSALS